MFSTSDVAEDELVYGSDSINGMNDSVRRNDVDTLYGVKIDDNQIQRDEQVIEDFYNSIKLDEQNGNQKNQKEIKFATEAGESDLYKGFGDDVILVRGETHNDAGYSVVACLIPANKRKPGEPKPEHPRVLFTVKNDAEREVSKHHLAMFPSEYYETENAAGYKHAFNIATGETKSSVEELGRLTQEEIEHARIIQENSKLHLAFYDELMQMQLSHKADFNRLKNKLSSVGDRGSPTEEMISDVINGLDDLNRTRNKDLTTLRDKFQNILNSEIERQNTGIEKFRDSISRFQYALLEEGAELRRGAEEHRKNLRMKKEKETTDFETKYKEEQEKIDLRLKEITEAQALLSEQQKLENKMLEKIQMQEAKREETRQKILQLELETAKANEQLKILQNSPMNKNTKIKKESIESACCR